eukprot:TRINITY_DN6506_c0_g1_i1.p1 TRINITY_DN6506_c0_g1~~TRINITY_DN6506_c0_g1_i1.p1  ORF type:complete len:566 (+),score=121.35 TRINITY_DN6506_c0_g1_i1:150-1847(+)
MEEVDDHDEDSDYLWEYAEEQSGRGKKALKNIKSGNHLLNFNYRSSSQNQPRPNYNRSRTRSKGTSPFNKEQFLQANFKFVVLGDNKPIEDPDAVVDWDTVVLVEYGAVELPSCPICLENPTCTQVSTCGHMMCYPCAVHCVQASSAKNGKVGRIGKCPICWDMLELAVLKPVICHIEPDYPPNEFIDFQLLHRPKTSIFPIVPNVSEEEAKKFIRIKTTDNIEKLARAQREELIQIRDKLMEDEEMEKLVHTDVPQISAVPFVALALEFLEERTKAQTILRNSILREKSKSKEDGALLHDTAECFHLYQEHDGQPMFLHPLDFRILSTEYPAHTDLPSVIRGKILETEEFTLTEGLRKRYKAVLGHMAVSSTIRFIEIDMKPLVSKETLHIFADELTKRSRRRKSQERKDLQEKRREEEIEAETLATRKANILTEQNFPDMSSGLDHATDDEISAEEMEAIERATRDSLQQNSPPKGLSIPGTASPLSTSPNGPMSSTPPNVTSTSPGAWGSPLGSSPGKPSGSSFMSALKSNKPSVNGSPITSLPSKKKGQYVILSNSNRRRN